MCDDWDDNAPVVVAQPHVWNHDSSRDDDSWDDGTPTTSSFASNNYQSRGQNDRQYNRDRGEFKPRRDNNWRNPNQGRNDKCEVIKVPSHRVGRVIGRGGSKIAELQTESGARIQVTKDSDGNDTDVKIFGTDETIAKAKALIKDVTADTIRFVEAKDLHKEPVKQPVITDWAAFLKECQDAENAEWDKYPPVIKDFYREHPAVTKMTENEVARFREENNNIVVDRTFQKPDSKPIPKPCPEFHHAFHQFPDILEEIRKAGFEKPSPIQAQAWPVLLSGEDLIGIAQTGTGKTLAFLLPALIHIDGQTTPREERGGPAVLIMAPTRELALQIDKEIKKYQYKNITSVCIYGGGNRREQVKTVTEGVDIVIATPGRMNDLVAAGHLDVKSVTYTVLDEADRMLDMGFEPQIRKVMYTIRPTRHTVMTSATWPPGVRRLAESYMNDPVQIYVGTLDLAATHTFMEFAKNLSPEQKVIVFCGKKARADELATELILSGLNCQTMHGDRDQADREQALLDIADGTVQILIATDLASRGLDIDDITHVVNYDFPKNVEEYVHRVGRTGRAGKFGESISYFTRANWAQAKELISILEEAQQVIKLLNLIVKCSYCIVVNSMYLKKSMTWLRDLLFGRKKEIRKEKVDSAEEDMEEDMVEDTEEDMVEDTEEDAVVVVARVGEFIFFYVL
ncbi:unnamed protein product [Phyllotreta striolata]|uniref:RNA helicase n=1 Tax=Phyllotreta striolata TaxID=444603 RepID=A0A9N9XSQ0_PHYSR|nr:unnamed protein product [Phyllotreta striolata]